MPVWRKHRFDPEATQDVRAQLVEEGFERLAEILYEPLAKMETDHKELEARVRGLEQERAKWQTETGVTRIIGNIRNEKLVAGAAKHYWIILTAALGFGCLMLGRCSAGH